VALEIRYSEAAAAQLAEMKARGEAKPDSAHGAVWRAFVTLLRDWLSDPTIALDRQHALGNNEKEGQDFRRIYRMRVGRARVFYIGSTARNRLIILLVGQRKAGDKRDAYRELSRWLQGADWDKHFTELGIKKPPG